ncbi:MAG: hypothetical protein ACI35Q_05390 [Marinilabiliaceae bacterium]
MRRVTGKWLRDRTMFCVALLSFGLWGMASVMMRPASHSLGRIFDMTGGATGDSVAFHYMYMSFLLLALPLCLSVRRYGFKTMLVIGLTVFAAGTLAFAPAAEIGRFNPFLLGFTMMSIGLMTIELSAFPYVLTCGVRRRSLSRIMTAQTLNAAGWVGGYYLASSKLIHSPSGHEMTGMSALDIIADSVAQREALWAIATPYMLVGAVAFAMAIAVGSTAFYDRPQDEAPKDGGFVSIARKLIHDKVFVLGTLCQFAYMMAQTLCWTGILIYGTTALMDSCASDLSRTEASRTAEYFVTIGVIAFGVFRLLGAVFAALGKFKASKVLVVSAAAAFALCAASLFAEEYAGLVCMVGVSACMSIMYPTIYYLSMRRQNISGVQVGTTLHVLCIFGGLAARSIMPASGGEALVVAISMLLFCAVGAYGYWCKINNVGL